MIYQNAGLPEWRDPDFSFLIHVGYQNNNPPDLRGYDVIPYTVLIKTWGGAPIRSLPIMVRFFFSSCRYGDSESEDSSLLPIIKYTRYT